MEKLLKLLILISCLFFLFSCQNNNEKYVINKYKDESYLKSEYYLNEIGDTILNGKCSIFSNKDVLILSSNLLNNEIYGRTKYYNSNGKIDSIKYIINKKEIGEIEWFHKNGKICKYNFYDDLNNLNFYAKYDLNGNLESCNGLILIEVFQFKLNQKKIKKVYKIGEKVKYQFMFPNIPNTTRFFKYKLLNFDNSKIIRTEKKIEPVTLEVEDICIKKGKNIIEAQIKYIFNDKNKIILSDTISFEYFVK